MALPLTEELELYPGLHLRPDLFQTVENMDSALFPSLGPNPTMYRRVYTPDNLAGSLHRYKFHANLKSVETRKVTAIPFAHPRDLVKIFATLRQFALVTTLLESCFAVPGCSAQAPDGDAAARAEQEDELSAFMRGTEPDAPAGLLPVDITLEPEHRFGIRVTAPGAPGEPVTNLQVKVGKNAELVVVAAEEGDEAAKEAERALRKCEDVGLALAWMRRRRD